MRKFKDNMGQEWILDLHIDVVTTCKVGLGLDILNPSDFTELAGSLTERLAYVFKMCEEQATKYELDIRGFEKRLTGPGFADGASVALLSECADFFRRLGQIGMAEFAEATIKTMQKALMMQKEMLDDGSLSSILQDAAAEIEKQMQPIKSESENGANVSPVSDGDGSDG